MQTADSQPAAVDQQAPLVPDERDQLVPEEEMDPYKAPFDQKQEGDAFVKKGDYQAGLKAYSKALMAVKFLMKDNMIDAGKLVNEYAKQVIVAWTHEDPLPRQHDPLLFEPRRLQECGQVCERGAEDGRDKREGVFQAGGRAEEPRAGTLQSSSSTKRCKTLKERSNSTRATLRRAKKNSRSRL